MRKKDEEKPKMKKWARLIQAQPLL